MNKFYTYFLCAGVALLSLPAMAVTIKKAAPVAKTETSSVAESAGSLVPTVIGLYNNVQQLTATQKALTAECEPSSQEISFVDSIVKEWAKTGAATADEVQTRLGVKRCSVADGGYSVAVKIAAGTDGMDLCYDYFDDKLMVWNGFPKVGKTSYCTDGAPTCSDKSKETVSNIYDIFNLVDFSAADYTAAEATMAANLLTKIETCSYAKLSAKKKAAWGGFLVDTIGGLGQGTNTSSIMDSVGSLTAGGGFDVSSLGGIAMQFMDK